MCFLYQEDRYLEMANTHCYREVREDRETNVNSSLNNSGNITRRSQEPSDPERGKILLSFLFYCQYTV